PPLIAVLSQELHCLLLFVSLIRLAPRSTLFPYTTLFRSYLVAAGDVQEDATVKRAGFVDLGSIKGNVGDQNYDVPADLDLSKYRAATIWCRRFGVNFGTAPLGASQM